jgi:hypothetical protein
MKNAVIVNQLFDLDLFMICTVQSNTTGSLEETLSNHSRLPIMKNIGVDVNRIAAENNNNTTNDIYSSDALNIEWYKSEKHKKLQHSYGLPDSLFAKNTHPLTVSVLGEIHQRVGEVIREIRPKNKALFNISPNAMLARIVDLHPKIAKEVVNELFMHIKFHAADKTQPLDIDSIARLGLEEKDLEDSELAVHFIDMVACMLIAHKGKGESMQDWIAMLQQMISACTDTTKIIRESILQTLEKNFFFYADSIDIPILSEEQVNQIEEMATKTQEATMEILKSGKSDQVDNLNAKKEELGFETDSLVFDCIIAES